MTPRVLAVLAALGAASCAALPGFETPARGTAEACVPLFREFDRLERLYGTGSWFEDSFVGPPALMEQGMDLLRADCITAPGDLRLAAAPRTPVTKSGPPIRPIALHAGVAAGLLTELRAREYFAARGVRVRSVGDPALGRRIYLGPFSTEGGLQAAAQAAREVGFVAPYPARF